MTAEVKLQNTVSEKKKSPKRRKIASLDRKKSKAGWLFVLPFIIGFVLIYLPIIYDSIKLSFVELSYATGGGYIYTPVGWENYRQALFVDTSYVQTLLSGLQQLALDIPAIIIFSLFMAVLLNQKMTGRAVFRAIFFIPVILSTGIMESIESQNILTDMMGSSEGINDGSGASTTSQIVSVMDIEKLFDNLMVGQGLAQYVSELINNIFNIVNRSGVQMLIFLAGLQSISPAIYESCQIDGATGWETFWKITFPMISPMILVNAIYTIIDSFTTDSNVVMKYIESVYNRGDQTISTAMSWMYFLIVIAILAIIGALFSMFVFYQRRD